MKATEYQAFVVTDRPRCARHCARHFANSTFNVLYPFAFTHPCLAASARVAHGYVVQRQRGFAKIALAFCGRRLAVGWEIDLCGGTAW